MRDVPSVIAGALSGPVHGIAYLWRIVRADGVALGFTTHDRPLTVEGMTYVPAPGIEPSAVSESGGTDGGDAEVAGALTHPLLCEADFATGRYDGAVAEFALCLWTDLEAGRLLLSRGTMGTVRRTGATFEAELASSLSALGATPIELTTPECRARLGDHRCRVDLTRRRIEATLTEVAGRNVVSVDAALPPGVYRYGRMRALSGEMAGRDFGVAETSDAEVSLVEAAAGLAVGDRVELTEGCDRRYETCRMRFGNGRNFQGEPFVPGRDSALRYPGV